MTDGLFNYTGQVQGGDGAYDIYILNSYTILTPSSLKKNTGKMYYNFIQNHEVGGLF